MKSSDNIHTNKLNPGISFEEIDRAISKSGYPLQTVIADKLRSNFDCQEEWSFIDYQTNELRSLDIIAKRYLYNVNEKNVHVRPSLNLLIECKQSELPYVFFLSPEKIKTYHYPLISGLYHKQIKVSTNDELSTTTYPISAALDLQEDEFVLQTAPSSMTFSKCVRTGKAIALSGTESFQGLVLPLLKSMQYFNESKTPLRLKPYSDACLTLGIAVIDGPMIGVNVDNGGHSSELMPWIRVFRHESYKGKDEFEREKLLAIDVVHKDFFDQFIHEHVYPYAMRFSTKVLKHQDVIINGKAFAKEIGKNWWSEIEPRLQKKTITNSIFKRFKK